MPFFNKSENLKRKRLGAMMYEGVCESDEGGQHIKK